MSNRVRSFIDCSPVWLVAIASIVVGTLSVATSFGNGYLWGIIHVVGGLFLIGVGAIAAIMGYGIYMAATSKD